MSNQAAHLHSWCMTSIPAPGQAAQTDSHKRSRTRRRRERRMWTNLRIWAHLDFPGAGVSVALGCLFYALHNPMQLLNALGWVWQSLRGQIIEATPHRWDDDAAFKSVWKSNAAHRSEVDRCKTPECVAISRSLWQTEIKLSEDTAGISRERLHEIVFSYIYIYFFRRQTREKAQSVWI